MEKDSREKLLEAATPLFAQKGFFAVSIRELANAAGTNSALISYHFGGKEGLYAAVLEQQFAQISKDMEKINLSSQSPLEKIQAYILGLARTHRERPFLLRFAQMELINPTSCLETVLKKYVAKFYTFLSGAIEEGIDQGQFKEDIYPGYAALALAGMMNFYFIAQPIAGTFLALGERSDEEYVQQVLKIYLQGLQKEEERK